MKMMIHGLLGAAAWFALCTGAGAQTTLSYNSGLNVAPGYEGWEVAEDGTRYFVFGYMNRNWEEEIDVPVGPANGFSPGAVDLGQPTHFLPRRNRFIFRVKVPANFTEKDELVWTLTSNGKTERAYATLSVDYKMDDVVKASETGALGAGSSSPEIRANKPPTVAVQGAKSLTARVGQPVKIVAVIADDGVPKRRGEGPARAAAVNAGPPGEGEGRTPPPTPRGNRAMLPPYRITVGKNLGLHLSWFVYRGAGKVMFDPPQVKAWEDTRAGANSPWAPIWAPPPMPADGRISINVTFSEPGTYVLRGMGDDGALLGWDDVTVTVTP